MMLMYSKLFLFASAIMMVKAGKKNVIKKIREPFLVQIDIDDARGAGLLPRTDTMTCTGIIIGTKIVMSACHCFTDDGDKFYDTWRVEIIAGTGNSWDPPPLTQKIKARKIVPHPKCTLVGNGRWDKDLAYVILQSHLDFNEYVREIKVAPKVSGLKVLMTEPATCTLYGLEPGKKDHPEERPKKQILTNVTLMPDETCHKYMCKFTNPDSYFCQRQWWKDGYVCGFAPECLGHSGGALVCNNLLYAVDTYNLCKPKSFPIPITSLQVMKSLWKSFWADGDNRILTSPWDRKLVDRR